MAGADGSDGREATKTGQKKLQPVAAARLAPRLLVVSGARYGAFFSVDEALSIGRGRENQLIIDDPAVSRAHARVERDGDTFILRDLGSHNGTFVNENRVAQHELAFGDLIRIGGTVSLFTHANPIDEEFIRRTRVELLGRIGAGLAHDFGNTLAAAFASAECLKTFQTHVTFADPTVRACIDDLLRALGEAREVSRRLVEVGRREGFSPERVSISRLCRDVAQMAAQAQPRVNMALDVQDNLAVMGDAADLHRALTALVASARDMMPRGGTVRLSASPQAARTGAPAQAMGMIAISVSDEGPVVDPGLGERVSDPLFSIRDGADPREATLASIAEVAKCHGGRMRVDDAKPGTRVTLLLPAAAPDVELSNKDTNRGIEPLRASTPVIEKHNLSILVIDDNEIVRRTLERSLLRLGYTVRVAAGGHEGLREVERMRPDVVLLDLDMPDLSGDQVYAKLVNRRLRVPTIIMSGHGVSQARDPRMWGGKPPAFIQKPFDIRELRGAIHEVLKAGKGPAS